MKYEHWEPDTAWEEYDDYPVDDWKYEVVNDDTRLGYVDWVNHKLEAGD